MLHKYLFSKGLTESDLGSRWQSGGQKEDDQTDFKTYYNNGKKHWERRESLEINPRKYGQMIFSKGVETTKWRKEFFQQMVWQKLDIHKQNNEAGHLLYTMYKN